MSRLLDDLSPVFRPYACELIARCAEQLIAVMVIDTLRTPAEQKAFKDAGVSWTLDSFHLPCPICGKSHAIDLCPFLEYQLHGKDKLQWNALEPAWHIMGAIGEGLGMTWGGRWKKRDMGHFQGPRCT